MGFPAAAATLQRSLLFSSISPEDITDLLATAEEKNLKSGEYVFWEGEAPCSLFLIISGRVKVIKHGCQGR